MSYNSETYDDVTYDTGILIGDVDLIESPDRFADIEVEK